MLKEKSFGRKILYDYHDKSKVEITKQNNKTTGYYSRIRCILLSRIGICGKLLSHIYLSMKLKLSQKFLKNH